MLASSDDFRAAVLFWEVELVLEFVAENDVVANDVVGFCMATGIGCCSTLGAVCRFLAMKGRGPERTLPV